MATNLAQAIDAHVTEADWQKMATVSGESVADLKKKIVPQLQAEFGNAVTSAAPSAPAAPTFLLPARTAQGNCETQSFEVSLFKVIGLAGELKLCGDSSDWSAELKAYLVVAGAKVWSTSYQFDSHNLRVCFSPDVGLAKANICFTLEVSSHKICLNIAGKACVWALGWHCGDFDVTLFCIPLP